MSTPSSESHRAKRSIPWKYAALVAWLVASGPFAAAQVPPPLFTPAATFKATDRYVATTVFHWYTPTGGQRSGPWLPQEGRTNWTGEPGWWQGQIKQMMSANIDVLYVHLIPSLEAQRRNLFIALNQLRAEGYDTPKVAPFLDPLVTWHDQPPVDLATPAGKNEFVGQYIRFFEQYFAASTGAAADDYLARQDGKPILDTWHVHLNCTNVASLTRADVAGRLSAAFGAAHPDFRNGFVMVTAALNPPTLSFADEKVPQFEINQYYSAFTQNTVQSVQLKGGYWDQNIRNPGDFLPRAGGGPYRTAWNRVDRTTTHRVYIESWNEYDEGTGIYAAQNAPYVAPANTGGRTDQWSATNDPFEYIKTTAQGAAAFNDTPAQDAVVLWHNLPATLTPGETRTATVIVRNTGDASWTAATNYKLSQAAADTAFVTGKRVLIDDAQDEIPLYGGIFRGRAKAFHVSLTAPASPGVYTTRWRMLQEGGNAFGQELVVPIEVKNKTAATVTLGNLAQVSDGTPRAVSFATTPAALTVDLTYNGSPYPPTSVGSYAVVGTIDDPSYHGRATATLEISTDPNLIAAAGSFESSPVGATVTSPPDVADAASVAGWRVFNVDSRNASFTATIVGTASTGSRALRLSVNNSGGTASYALDQWQREAHTPVQQGADYVVSFDAAWIAGATINNLLFQVQEFDRAGVFLRNGLSQLRSVGTASYQTHTLSYRPVDPATAEIGLFFGPMRGVIGTTTITLDTIKLIKVAPSRLINLSILTSLTTLGDTFTIGYVVGGAGTSGSKPLVIRAAGPSLGALGVPATLDDPKLELFAGSAKIGENDNWGGSDTVANAMAAVGAFAYSGPTSRDSAAVLSVASGDNSVKVSAVGNGTGAVIAEIYDATPATSNASATPRLVNVSVLKALGTGFTAGFVIGGVANKNVLVRAIGPTLAGFGVDGAVSDPQLALYTGAQVIGTNDNWGGESALATAFSSVGAFALTPASRDAALVANLSPGSYTVQVSGVGGTTGNVLVEIYEIP